MTSQLVKMSRVLFMLLIFCVVWQAGEIMSYQRITKEQYKTIDIQHEIIEDYQEQADDFYNKVQEIGKEYAKGTSPGTICKIFSDAVKSPKKLIAKLEE